VQQTRGRHPVLQILSGRRNAAVEIFLHHKRGDRGCPGGSETGVLDVYGNGYPGVLPRGEADEDGVLVTVRILSRTCLSADVQSLDSSHPGSGSRACRSIDGLIHPLYDALEIYGVNHGVVLFAVSGIQGVYAVFLDYMGYAVPASVGYCGRQVGQVERSASQLALPDGQGYYGEGFPSVLAVDPVVGVG